MEVRSQPAIQLSGVCPPGYDKPVISTMILQTLCTLAKAETASRAANKPWTMLCPALYTS